MPPDPALEPVQAAKDFMAAQATQQAAVAPASAPQRQRPVITPANPQDWSTTVPLQFPLVVDGVTVTALTLRRLTARDVADLVIDGFEGISLNAAARAKVCGVDPDVLEALAAADAEVLLGAIGPFLPPAVAALAEAMEEALIDEAGQSGMD
jgi:hypothetical protein